MDEINQGGPFYAGSRSTQVILPAIEEDTAGVDARSAGENEVGKLLEDTEAAGANEFGSSGGARTAAATLYRWHKALREEGPAGLGTKSRRPLRVRGPTWSAELSQAVHKLREGYPRWGKDKLAILLRRQGWQVSTSMTGRILTSLKARGTLKEPPRYGVSARSRPRRRPYAVRKPREYRAMNPGDIVQVDTLDIRPPARCGAQALHGPRRGLQVGRDRGTHPSHVQPGGTVPGLDAAAVPLSHQGRSRSMEAVSSRLPSRRRADSWASGSSYCRRVIQSLMVTSREGTAHAYRGVLRAV